MKLGPVVCQLSQDDLISLLFKLVRLSFIESRRLWNSIERHVHVYGFMVQRV